MKYKFTHIKELKIDKLGESESKSRQILKEKVWEERLERYSNY